MYNVTEVDNALKFIIAKDKTAFEAKLLENISEHEKTLKFLHNTTNLSHTHNLEINKVVWNLACYIHIVSYDLKILIKHMSFSENEWEKRYFIRQTSLLIYEATNDLLQLFGKSFRSTLDKMPSCETLKTELNVIIKELNAHKKANENKLKAIRNISIAHRDDQSLEQLKIVYSLSWVEAITYSSSFDDIIKSATKFLQKMVKLGFPEGNIREYL